MSFTQFTTSTANVQGLATKPTESGTQVKVIMDKGSTDIKAYLNSTLIAEMEAIADGTSGADSIGATAISTSPESVQGILEWLFTQIIAVSLSEIVDGSITDAKLSSLAGDLLARYAAHIILASSETVKAHVELATAAETTTGTSSLLAVHPAGLKVETDKLIPLTQRAATNGVATLDSAGNLAQMPYVIGTYTGNDATSRLIVLGFQPSAVLVTDATGRTTAATQTFGGLALPSYPSKNSAGAAAVTVETTGFTVYDNNTTLFTNTSVTDLNPYRYIAFK